jgi:hypothetical protein
MGRFLSDEDQRTPSSLRQVPSEAEAEARMFAQLRAFDAQFLSSGNPPGDGSSARRN